MKIPILFSVKYVVVGIIAHVLTLHMKSLRNYNIQMLCRCVIIMDALKRLMFLTQISCVAS